MKTIPLSLCSLFLCSLLASLSNAANAAQKPQEILAASDAVRNPDYPFGLTNTLVEYRSGKQTDTSTLAIYSKADSNSGQFRSLIRYVAPARDANKLILYNGKDLWFYDPSSKGRILMSPQQLLREEATNGVVVMELAEEDQEITAL